jgi:hypothetical protein
MIKKYYRNWKSKTKSSFKKNFPQSLINIILILLITYIMIDYVISFSFIAFLGYLAYSIINLNKLIKNPFKSALWALIYIICAILFDLFLSTSLPMLEKGDGASIFSGLVLAIIILYLWIKVRKLK